MSRPFDLVVFGATGFTGSLIAEDLAEHAPPTLRWALAGRHADKVERQVRRLAAMPCPPSAALVADIDDALSLARMTSATRVILSTVGPFDRLGDAVVESCIAAGTDYLDIAGEARFLHRLVDEHHSAAAARGVRLIPCCGFGSVPHDLGVQYTLEHLPRDVPVKVEGFVRMRIPFSGGTWHSAVDAFGRPRRHRHRRRRRRDETGRRIRMIRPHIRWEREIRGWACWLPTVDPAVVVRSARLDERYGPDFRYGHYLRVHRWPTLVAGAAAAGALLALARWRPSRDLLLRLREPGAGPTDAERARAWFRVTLIGRAGGQKVITEVTGGDPGHGESSKMAAEAALCLALRRAELPARRGVLTPASGLGPPLRRRLQERGIGFRVVCQVRSRPGVAADRAQDRRPPS